MGAASGVSWPPTCASRQRNEEIVAAERLARSVLEQAADAVLVCDDRGQIIRCNKAAETLYGRSPLFRSFSDAFPIALASQTAGTSDIALTALGGQSLTGVPASLSRADSPVDLLVSAGALRNTAGSVIGCVVTLVDVTELRRAERALRQADHNKDEFLALLSHELRNPLAPIRNSIYILERSSPGGEQAHRARAVLERQVGQLTRLVDDLLDITRIERNKVQLQRQRVELGGLVRRATEDFHFLFDKAELELEFECAPRPLMVDADSARIAQVLGNLLHNSIKFTGKGGRVRVEVADDARSRWCDHPGQGHWLRHVARDARARLPAFCAGGHDPRPQPRRARARAWRSSRGSSSCTAAK